MRLLVALAVGVCACALAASGSLGRSSPQPLAWAPPALTDPLTIDVTNANRRLVLEDGRDYVLRLVEPLTRELWIEGGRNVVVVGGWITLDQLGASSLYQDNTAVKVRFGDPGGTVHLEGLLVDGPYVNDGIAVATSRDVQIQNVRVERAYDRIKGGHADCVQIQGGVGDLRTDRFTCSTERQGIFLGDHSGPIGSAELRNTNIYGAPGKHLFWRQSATYPVALRSVWLEIASGFSPWAPFGFWVYPQQDGRTYDGRFDKTSRAVVTRDGKRLSFVGSRIRGVIRKGRPPGGDYVDADAVGMAYVSPGYLSGLGSGRAPG
jgi:hypothetical protein